jgi:DNA-binding response OmpR family regulator
MCDLSPSAFDFTVPGPSDPLPAPADLSEAALANANLLSTANGRILLVEPIPIWRRELALFLEHMGCTVISAADGLTGLNCFGQAAPIDLVLVAAEMPRLNGLGFCALLRQSSYVPIIVLNDCTSVELLVRSIASGADDCIDRSSPWILLYARIRALIQRICAFQQSTCGCLCATGGITLHESGAVTVRNHTIGLTPLETQLLHYLMDHQGHPVSSCELLHKVWGYNENTTDLVRVAIRRLRQKIENDPNHPDYIITVPGFGYCFSRSAAQH